MPDGAARQGLPTSPSLANLIASDVDNEIIETLQCKGRMRNMVYTRYADDLTFSFNSRDMISTLARKVPEIVEKWGFKINTRKTKIQWAGAGMRMVTGVGVDKTGIHCPRYVKRKLRAARHQLQVGLHGRTLAKAIRIQAEHKKRHVKRSLNAILVGCYKGLEEWSSMRLPKAWNQKINETKMAPAPTAIQIARTVLQSIFTMGRKI